MRCMNPPGMNRVCSGATPSPLILSMFLLTLGPGRLCLAAAISLGYRRRHAGIGRRARHLDGARLFGDGIALSV